MKENYQWIIGQTFLLKGNYFSIVSVTWHRVLPCTDTMRTRQEASDCWRVGNIQFMIDRKSTHVHQINLSVMSTKSLSSMKKKKNKTKKKTAPHIWMQKKKKKNTLPAMTTNLRNQLGKLIQILFKSTYAKVHDPLTSCLKCFHRCYYTITRQASPMAGSYQYQWLWRISSKYSLEFTLLIMLFRPCDVSA